MKSDLGSNSIVSCAVSLSCSKLILCHFNRMIKFLCSSWQTAFRLSRRIQLQRRSEIFRLHMCGWVVWSCAVGLMLWNARGTRRRSLYELVVIYQNKLCQRQQGLICYPLPSGGKQWRYTGIPGIPYTAIDGRIFFATISLWDVYPLS